MAYAQKPLLKAGQGWRLRLWSESSSTSIRCARKHPRFWRDCMYMLDNGISTKILCAGPLFEVGMISPNIYIHVTLLSRATSKTYAT